MKNYKLTEKFDIPRDYIMLQLPKKIIATKVKEKLKEQNLTYRQACEKIENLNYTQFSRVTSASTYTIDTLLKTLDGLGLEIQIVEKKAE
ncbi:hypothetical protein ABC255_02160 [Neobacillus sp. 3P2-tot-E-2]|uniref:hypothetical protein n=1 Tax=Neobacillus sp. 3P2-tot-E-2 TaxID=3132212 RepID=UPI0039A38FF0